MTITETNRGMVMIDDAHIVYRNFAGRGSQFNREGDMNFAVVIPDVETAEKMKADGWNVKIKPSKSDPDEMFCTLPVKVKFNGRGPNIYVRTGDKQFQLPEEAASTIDNMAIISCDMNINPYHWEVNGKTGTTAYLQSLLIRQEEDRFAAFNADIIEEDYHEDDTPF